MDSVALCDAVTRVDSDSYTRLRSRERCAGVPLPTATHVRNELEELRKRFGAVSSGWCAVPMVGRWAAYAYLVEADGERTMLAFVIRPDDRSALRALLAELFIVSGDLRGAP